MSSDNKKENKPKVRKVYSEDWKREKIKLLEAGEIRIRDLIKTYGLNYTSVSNWREKYGKLDRPEKLVLEKESDYLKCVALQKELKDQQSLIGRMHIQLEYFKGIVSEINKQYDIDAEKKFG